MSPPYKALWGDLLAFTFSEELGFEEGEHGWSCVSIDMKSVTILAVCAPSYPFYGGMTSSDPVQPILLGNWLLFTHRV